MEQGILIGADHSYERLLLWWHHYFKKQNDLPVAILDFGLSPWGIEQAKKIGMLIDATKPSNINLSTPNCPIRGEIWHQIKEPCFKRLLNFKQSPFHTTLWLDLDCQVNCDLLPLFAFADHKSRFAAVPLFKEAKVWQEKNHLILPNEISYNGGVLVFKKDSPILDLWLQALKTYDQNFVFDDIVLSKTLAHQKIEIGCMPTTYNCFIEGHKIVHHMGKNGKREIFNNLLYRRQVFPPFKETIKSNERGVLIGCDREQEKFLRYWYQNYRAFNNFPVAILDLGMSSAGKRIAQKIGRVIQVDQLPCPSPLEKICSKAQKYYVRFVQKPSYLRVLNLHRTPFDKTIMLDIDTEIRGYLGHLFDLINIPAGFAANIFKDHIQQKAKEDGLISPHETYYSCMIAYTKDSPIIGAWQKQTLNTTPFLGDDVTLSKAIAKHNLNINLIPTHYNRLYTDPMVVCPSTKIIHFNGPEGKIALFREMMLQSTLATLTPGQKVSTYLKQRA